MLPVDVYFLASILKIDCGDEHLFSIEDCFSRELTQRVYTEIFRKDTDKLSVNSVVVVTASDYDL